MIPIPYSFTGEVNLQRYYQVESRIKAFDFEEIGWDSSGTYPMYAIHLGDKTKPTIMITAGVHGSEWQGVSYTMSLMEMLKNNTYPDTAFRTNLLNNYHIVCIPVVNPYGYDRAHLSPYEQFNNTARYNVNGLDLNGDFYNFTQSESQNVQAVGNKYQPFSVLDVHLFQPMYDVAYGKNFIFANAQPATVHVRNTIVDSWKDYIGQDITVWTNTLDQDSGLLRAHFGRQTNPHTPHTLAYISEIERPAVVGGTMIEDVSPTEIFDYGCANIFLFLKTSMDYHELYNITNGDIIQTPHGDIIITRDGQGVTQRVEERYQDRIIVTTFTRDQNGTIISFNRVKS